MDILGIGSFFTSVGNIILYSLIALAVVTVLAFLLKYRSTRILTLYVLSFAIIVAGIISTVQIVKTLDIKSQEIGSAYQVEAVQDYKVISEFELTYVDFETEDYVNYSATVLRTPENFNGVDKDYIMLLNESPAYINNVYAGKMDSSFSLNFYNSEETVLSTADVRVVIEYLAKETRITITMKNINSSVSYMNSYMELNGMTLKVIERGI